MKILLKILYSDINARACLLIFIIINAVFHLFKHKLYNSYGLFLCYIFSLHSPYHSLDILDQYQPKNFNYHLCRFKMKTTSIIVASASFFAALGLAMPAPASSETVQIVLKTGDGDSAIDLTVTSTNSFRLQTTLEPQQGSALPSTTQPPLARLSATTPESFP